MITIEVRTTCPGCGGSGREAQEGGPPYFKCSRCHGTGTVVDAERSQWLRTVVERMADDTYWVFDGVCDICWSNGPGSTHAPDCIHEMARAAIQ